MKHPQNDPESGNVLFYILIAVALLGALTFAITQSGRGNIQKLNEERARILAQELIEYTNTLSAGVTQLKLRGVRDNEICFDDSQWPGTVDYDHAGCVDPYNMVFNTEGAGIFLTFPPEEAMNPSAVPDNLWHFTGANEIEGVGTTCGGNNCVDLLVSVDELKKEVCVEINKLVSVGTPGANPPVDTAYDTTAYQGAYGYVSTIGDEGTGTDLIGEPAGCFRASGTGKYVYYKVLVSR